MNKTRQPESNARRNKNQGKIESVIRNA